MLKKVQRGGVLGAGALAVVAACGGSVETAGGNPQPGAIPGTITTGDPGSNGGTMGGSGSTSGGYGDDATVCASGCNPGGDASGASSSGAAIMDAGSGPALKWDGATGFLVPAAPAGLAGFAFVVNGGAQTPLPCAAESWEFAPPAPQAGVPLSDAAVPGQDTVCNGGTAPCPGLRTFLVNTGAYPVAYTAQTTWSVGGGSGQPPGVPFGNTGELSGVLDPGGQVEITSVYAGGITAVLGSSRPFVDPDAGKYVADGAVIPWPAGVTGSGGASQMYVAEIEILDACHTPSVVW